MSKVTGPHRDLKIERLRAAIALIPALAGRKPLISDPEFKQWCSGVTQLLRDLFAEPHMLGYTGRFVRIHFRSRVGVRGQSAPALQADCRAVWARGLQEAQVVLREALVEAELGLPIETSLPPTPVTPREKSIVINVNNTVSNAFSPTLHVTFSDLMGALDARELSPAEHELARTELVAIDSEAKGEQRWPIIARSLESLKALGKGVYKDIAVPLIVEFLKQQSGLKPPSQ